MPLNLDAGEFDREETFGRRVLDLRWQAGVLQMEVEERYKRTLRGRFVADGHRRRWMDVPGDAPKSDPTPKP